ncbi:MAG: hypothetical protein WCT51_03180 [Candidatus Shapirobacteria bacterium]|jgi:hypothetical protein
MDTIEDLKKSENVKDELLNLRNNFDNLKRDTESITAETRSGLAKKFVNLYFLTLALSFVIPWSFNLCIYLITGNSELFIPIKDMVLLISSTLGGPLGFIVAFYFKNER